MSQLAIQNVLIPHTEFLADMNACVATGIRPLQFGLIPFSNEITGDVGSGDEPVVPFGATKMIKLSETGNLPAHWRLFHGDAFEMQVWIPAIGASALNGDCRFACLGEIKDTPFATATFVKPADDRKAFNAMILEPGQTISARLAEGTQDSSLSDTQVVCMAPLMPIDSETRCWVIEGELVAMSLYRREGALHVATPPPDLVDSLSRFVDVLDGTFRPSPAYVVDIAVSDGALKVVEYNCINCSGRDAADRGALFRAMLAYTEASPTS